MKLKKINAAVSLLSALFLLTHIGYNVFCYLTMYYNPALKTVFTAPLMAAVMIHSVLGMLSVFLLSDGTRLSDYPGQNRKTVLQRVTAALFFPLLMLHVKTFELLSSAAKDGNYVLFVLILAADILFYLIIALHVSVSISRAFITLGILSSKEIQEKTDRAAVTAALIIVIIAAVVIVRGFAFMFMG